MMFGNNPKTSVSFPVTVSLCEETANICLTRHTEPGFQIEISPRTSQANGHRDLYVQLLSLLAEAGVSTRDSGLHLNLN